MRSLYKRPDSKYWWYRYTTSGHRFRVSLKTTSKGAATVRARGIILDSSCCLKEWRSRCRKAARGGAHIWLKQMVGRCKHINMKFITDEQITLEDILFIAIQSGGRCAVTKIPFAWDGDKPENSHRGISLDRIIPMKPYTFENIRLVLRGVNMAMNQWGEASFWEIAEAAVENKQRFERNKVEFDDNVARNLARIGVSS